jgi:hypothetical protein
MSWVADKERLQAEARRIDSAIRLVVKSGRFWRFLSWCLFLLSFGRFRREDFLACFATTLGSIQAYPESWSTDAVRRVMIHESRHSRQARLCGLGIHPMAGLPIMALLYALLPLPAGFAFFRFWFELDADRAAWRHQLANGLATPDEIRRRSAEFAGVVAGPAYLWPVWRGFALSRFAKEADKAIAEHSGK